MNVPSYLAISQSFTPYQPLTYFSFSLSLPLTLTHTHTDDFNANTAHGVILQAVDMSFTALYAWLLYIDNFIPD